MSRQLINQYRNRIADLHARTGSLNEGVLSAAFGRLLEDWGRSDDLTLVNQWEGKGPRGNNIRVDGALVPSVLRIPFGYWEAKDGKDNLDKEILSKIASGYPQDNIIYEDTREAILIQNKVQMERVPLQGDDEGLIRLLKAFFAYEREEITEFRKAAKQFRADLPQILEALREAIRKAETEKPAYKTSAAEFLSHAKEAINSAVTVEDVREMLIQHILTEEIFTSVFDSATYHRENNVARKLSELENQFFTGDIRHATMRQLSPYYNAIRHAATGIADRREKQTFLKKLYEDFYKVYNPKAADKLGVVYTPGEIVRFMIRSTDWLCEKHFDKSLIDKGVEILDPATGTGTFIVELLEHFIGDKEKLRHKYKEELHANEVAILPYYVANLNIEATYAAITGQFAEYPNLCFVDTLDNVAALGIYSGHQGDMFGSVSDENMARVKRQNERKISVIIGNPPYNANQQNENDNNKNRAYARIDERIKQTYIKASTAQKTKLYDMYSRFFRWASDRLTEDGVLAFITNRSFIESRTFDGFRKMVAQDFNEIWVVDLGGDVRANPKLSGTKHNVFGIQTGVAICYLVRKKGVEGCTIRYVRRPEDETAEDKLSWLGSADLKTLPVTTLKPNARNDWLNTESIGGWDEMLPIANASTKAANERSKETSIFKLYSLGVVTNRDEWVFGWTSKQLDGQVSWFVEQYELERLRLSKIQPKLRRESIEDRGIKLTRAVKNDLAAGVSYSYEKSRNRRSLYRPFQKLHLHFWIRLNEMQYRLREIFPDSAGCSSIVISGSPAAKPFQVLATDIVPGLDTLEKTQTLARYRYTKSGERVDNITDWAVAQFVGYYAPTPSPLAGEGGPAQAGSGEGSGASATQHTIGAQTRAAPSPSAADAAPSSPARGEGKVSAPPAITKDAIFAYCYAVLHDPLYREKYALNLKREFPRIPFYPDFEQWVQWGETLLKLHIDYEKVKPFKLTRIDTPAPKRAEGTHPKPKLKSNSGAGNIIIDEDTQLTGVPVEAWEYRLGNRSAIDWVLDQHKEKTPRDPTIRAKFNTYRFADYKEACIGLLAKVVTVSVETVAITEAMKIATRE